MYRAIQLEFPQCVRKGFQAASRGPSLFPVLSRTLRRGSRRAACPITAALRRQMVVIMGEHESICTLSLQQAHLNAFVEGSEGSASFPNLTPTKSVSMTTILRKKKAGKMTAKKKKTY